MPFDTVIVPAAPDPETGTAENWKVPVTRLAVTVSTVMLPLPPVIFAAHAAEPSLRMALAGSSIAPMP